MSVRYMIISLALLLEWLLDPLAYRIPKSLLRVHRPLVCLPEKPIVPFRLIATVLVPLRNVYCLHRFWLASLLKFLELLQQGPGSKYRLTLFQLICALQRLVPPNILTSSSSCKNQ